MFALQLSLFNLLLKVTWMSEKHDCDGVFDGLNTWIRLENGGYTLNKDALYDYIADVCIVWDNSTTRWKLFCELWNNHKI